MPEFHMIQLVPEDLDEFTKAYLEAIAFTDEEELSDAEFSEEFLERARQDCKKFQEENAVLLQGLDTQQCGHDFWLTRCGHGAGFWDSGLGEVGDKLTEAAKKFGNIDTYIGDDGRIYG